MNHRSTTSSKIGTANSIFLRVILLLVLTCVGCAAGLKPQIELSRFSSYKLTRGANGAPLARQFQFTARRGGQNFAGEGAFESSREKFVVMVDGTGGIRASVISFDGTAVTAEGSLPQDFPFQPNEFLSVLQFACLEQSELTLGLKEVRVRSDLTGARVLEEMRPGMQLVNITYQDAIPGAPRCSSGTAKLINLRQGYSVNFAWAGASGSDGASSSSQ